MVFVECTRDVHFVRALGVKRAKIVHAGGKGKVKNRIAKRLREAGEAQYDFAAQAAWHPCPKGTVHPIRPHR